MLYCRTKKVERGIKHTMAPWDDDGIWLFTPEELISIPDGTTLESISGDLRIKGVDYIDYDTRFGHTAWGIRNPFTHDLKDLFIEWRLKSGY